MKRFFKYFILTAGIGVLAFLFLIRTNAFQNWFKNRLVSALTDSLDAELSMGTLKSNFPFSLDDQDILLKTDQDTLAFLAWVRFHLTPLALLH